MHNSVSALPTQHWAVAEEATELIQQYPDLSKKEIERLVILYPRLPSLHVALMLSDEDLRPRLEAFRRAHAERLRPPLRHFGVFLIPIGIMLVVLVSLLLR